MMCRVLLLACLLCALWSGAAVAAGDESSESLKVAARGVAFGNEAVAWGAGVPGNATELRRVLGGMSAHINTAGRESDNIKDNNTKDGVLEVLEKLLMGKEAAESAAQDVENMRGRVPKDEEKIRVKMREVAELVEMVEQSFNNRSSEKDMAQRIDALKKSLGEAASLWEEALSGISSQLSEVYRASNATTDAKNAADKMEVQVPRTGEDVESVKKVAKELAEAKKLLTSSLAVASSMVMAATTVEEKANKAAKAFGDAVKLAAKLRPPEKTPSTKDAAPKGGRAALSSAEGCFLAVSHLITRLVLFIAACVTAAIAAA